MTSSRDRRDRGKSTCADRARMRLQRARHARREMSAHGAVAQLLAIFSALVSSMPLVPSPQATAGRRSTEPASTEGRVPSLRPPPSLDEAMRHIRGARTMSPRVRAALDALKRAAPSAADWIDERADWLEWSDITRCLIPGDEAGTSARLMQSASVWQAEKATVKEARNEQKADGAAYKP